MEGNEFLVFLESAAYFSISEKHLILDKCIYKTSEKGSYILKYGEICDSYNYVISGIVRFYWLNDEGEELTSAFITKNEIASRSESFIKNRPSNGYMQCITNCKFLTISKSDWLELHRKIKNFGYATAQLAALNLARQLEFQRRILNDEAIDSYREFRALYAEIIDQIPLKYIASFMGITPSSLSRIKKEITEK